MGLPVGSGAGLATNPSNFLMRAIVAALTAGAAQPEAGRQHLKSVGPGQRPSMVKLAAVQEIFSTERASPVAVLPVVHEEVKRHVPPVPHVLVQHRTSSGSLGQNPVCEVPPPEEQLVVVMQTPGTPLAVQAPFRAPNTVGNAKRR